MEIWVRIFKSNGKQVLVEKSTTDEGLPEILFRWQEDDFAISTGPSWKVADENSFNQRDNYFQRIDQKMVDGFVSKARAEILAQYQE